MAGLHCVTPIEKDFRMKKIALAAFASVAVLALAACGSSDKASEGAQAENVEMPAEEAMSGVDAGATPAADASTAASDAAAPEASGSVAATSTPEPKM
jgi:hypothetical protein